MSGRTDLELLKELADIVHPYHIMPELKPLYESATTGDWFGARLAVNTALRNEFIQPMTGFCKNLIGWREKADRMQRAA